MIDDDLDYIRRRALHEHRKAQEALLEDVNEHREQLGLPLREHDDVVHTPLDTGMWSEDFYREVSEVGRAWRVMTQSMKRATQKIAAAFTGIDRNDPDTYTRAR